jgi:glucosamine 6-phosphate synthetase-like amidotransferase/phosphosugar isomerase protein
MIVKERWYLPVDMCGIAAVFLHPQERTPQEWQSIRDIFTRNLLFNEERGRAATGLIITNTNGQADLYKLPLPASQFIQTPTYQTLLKSIGPQTLLILGHTRLPTQGDPAYAGNNHPIQVGPVFGVHNGHIANNEALFARFGYSRQAQVDSEIIFHMLARVSPENDPHNYLAQIRPQIELLQGQFTFIAGDLRTPQRLLVLKHNNPLCIHYHASWNALIFSSRYIFLRKAFGQSLVTEALEHDRLLLFDAATLGQYHTEPHESLALSFLAERI